jgi:hypothetical protein
MGGRSSLSDEKEAKRLLSGRSARWRSAALPKWIKVFRFLFFKKEQPSFALLRLPASVDCLLPLARRQ